MFRSYFTPILKTGQVQNALSFKTNVKSMFCCHVERKANVFAVRNQNKARTQSTVLQHGNNQLFLTEVLTDFCSPHHKLADASKLVAKIVFYRNTTSPAASFLSSTIGHKQFQILPLSLQAQIKENITHCSIPCLLRPVFPTFYLKTPVLCGQGYVVTLFD